MSHDREEEEEEIAEENVSERLESDVSSFISEYSNQMNIGLSIDEMDDVGGDGVEDVDQIGSRIYIGGDDVRGRDVLKSVLQPFSSIPTHKLSLTELQMVPKYLCDTLLSNKLPVGIICANHYSYWAWTACFISFLQTPRSRVLTGMNDQRPFAEFDGMLSEYYNLIHMILSPVKNELLDPRTRTFFASMNPNAVNMTQKSGFRFAGSIGFRLLEGLLIRRCSLIDSDGSITNNEVPITQPWATKENESVPEIKDSDNTVSYSEKIQIWCTHEATEVVSEVLDEINDLTRSCYSEEDLIRKLGENEEIVKEIKKTVQLYQQSVRYHIKEKKLYPTW